MPADRRIVLVLPGMTLAGAERQALLLARYLRDVEQAEVQVWALGSPGRVEEICQAEGFAHRIVRVTWPEDRLMRLKAIARFGRELRRARPDYVLPFCMRPNVVCGLVWRFVGARRAVWNQRDEGRADRVGRGWQKLALRLMPAAVTNSRHGGTFLVDQLGLAPKRLRHIPNGVALDPPQLDRAAWRARLGLGEDVFLAAMVANLHPFKDHPTLVRAWHAVVEHARATHRRAVLLLAGRFEGTEEPLRELIAELALGEDVRLLGQVDDIAGLDAAVDLGVFSSFLEGVPNGVLEQMASGLAVVATGSPGLREALGEQNAAHLAPPRDADAFAARVMALLDDAALRRRVGEANRARIAAEYAPEVMGRRMTAALVGEEAP